MKNSWKIIVFFLLFIGGIAYTEYRVNYAMKEAEMNERSNISAVSYLFVSSICQKYSCKMTTCSTTWSPDEFTRMYYIEKPEGTDDDNAAWQRFKAEADSVIIGGFNRMWVGLVTDPVITWEVDEDDQEMRISVSTREIHRF